MKPRIPHKFAVGIVALAMVVLTGCAQPPSEQLGAAQKSVDAAKAAGATVYAKEDVIALEQQLVLAQNELAKQQRALPIFRSYRDADRMLVKIVESGGRVAAKAAQNKEAAKAAAITIEQEAQQIVVSTKALMAQMSSGIDRVALEAIHQDIGRLEKGLSAVHQLIEMGEYRDAQLLANFLKKSGASVLLVIQDPIRKTTDRYTKPRA